MRNCLTTLLVLAVAGCVKPPEPKSLKGTFLPERPVLRTEEIDVEGNKLIVEIQEEGTGEEAKTGSTVSVHYVGRLEDGTEFDNSLDRGAPLTFPLGRGNVIQGWERGIPGMKVGEQRRLRIPPALGYGDRRSGQIPASSTLIFDVKLVDVRP
jgi:FKBP-type peptidyl-prolyl cis-trans isomerase